MNTSAASHIPTLSAPKFKSFGAYDPALVDVLEPGEEILAEPSLEERLQAEFERGQAAGDARMRAHYEKLLETERETHAKLIEEERVRFDLREAANVSAAIESCLNVMEQRISYSLAKLLQPFLKDRIVEQLVSAFAENLRQLTEASDEKLIRLSGPQSLVDKVMEQIPTLRDRIEVRVADQMELVALLNETTIETRIGQWLAQLDILHKETN